MKDSLTHAQTDPESNHLFAPVDHVVLRKPKNGRSFGTTLVATEAMHGWFQIIRKLKA
jgi:hypothetical protein